MAEQMYGLGGRLPLLDPGGLSDMRVELYDRIRTSVVPATKAAGFISSDAQGHLIGPFNATLYSPEICSSFLALQKTEAEHTTLSKRVRQVIILSVGSFWKSAYELYAHMAAGRAIGLTAKQVGTLAAGQETERLNADEVAAQAFTLELVSTRAVSSSRYAAAQETFGDRGVVEMVILIGCYLTVCALLNVFQVPEPEAAHEEAK
jgi:4-carboxymuconolactone decarboxylase